MRQLILTFAAGGAVGASGLFLSGMATQHPYKEIAPLRAAQSPQSEIDKAWRIVCQVESGGDPYAVGKAGERGIAQVTPIMLRDYEQITGNVVSLSQVHGKRGIALSYEVFRAYHAHYGFHATEEMCRHWNRGPGEAAWDARGDEYWRKCQKISQKTLDR